MHDLLGRTLSLIAVKAELASRLSAKGDPSAEGELADVQRLARQAVRDVREAVIGAHAQRGLLIEWGSWGDGQTAGEIFEAMARRQIEYYVIRPSQSPDELFHQSVSTFLLEWAHARRVSPHTVRIISESWTGRGQELKEILGRCAVPHAFLLADFFRRTRWSRTFLAVR